MRTPLAIRTTRRASRSTTSTWRGSRSHRVGELDGLGAWLDGRQVDDRALRLRDDLLGDDEDVVRTGAAADQARRSSASPRSVARSSPATISGIPSRATTSTRPRQRASTAPSRAPRRGGGHRACRGRATGDRRARRSGRRPRPRRQHEPPGCHRRTRIRSRRAARGRAHSSLGRGDPGRATTSGRSATTASGAISSASAAGETSGRSIGRMTIASAPPAIASSRASPRPRFKPWLRCRSVRAPSAAAARAPRDPG